MLYYQKSNYNAELFEDLISVGAFLYQSILIYAIEFEVWILMPSKINRTS